MLVSELYTLLYIFKIWVLGPHLANLSLIVTAQYLYYIILEIYHICAITVYSSTESYSNYILMLSPSRGKRFT